MKFVVAATVVLLAQAAAWALINPHFTPIHLVDQSQLILKARVAAKDIGNSVEMTVVGALKGKAPGRITLDLTKAVNKQHATAARKQLAATAARELLLFAGKYEDQDKAFLHAGGAWMLLSGGAAGRWSFDAVVTELGQGGEGATWAGGTDMLARCVEYILAAGATATVPAGSGTSWREGGIVSIGAVKGQATAACAVDLAGDGRLCLYVASPAGDVLLRPVKGKAGFEDVTAAVKLAAKSRASAWGDFNADGRLDLASFDGRTLTLWNQAADGTFSSVKAGGKFTIPAKCRSLATIGCGRAGRPALVVSGVAPPVLLAPAGNNAFKATPLPVKKKPDPKWGAPQAPLVADFDNDSFPDVIQPFEAEGLLFRGRPDGGFEPGAACGVHCTSGGGTAAVGDFDGDGWMDVLAAGGEGVAVFHNLHSGRFQETMELSGEISYKAQPFASGCGVCDFNNDARQDIFITYPEQQLLLYFNRGFRSFGQAPQLEMALAEDISHPGQPGQDGGPTYLEQGQHRALFADFDADGAQDFVVIMPKGDAWCAYNGLGESCKAVKLRLGPKPTFAGPLAVTLWQGKRCLGAIQVRRRRPGFFGIEEAGRYTLKYRFPGGREARVSVTVEDQPVDVLLKPAAPTTRPK